MWKIIHTSACELTETIIIIFYSFAEKHFPHYKYLTCARIRIIFTYHYPLHLSPYVIELQLSLGKRCSTNVSSMCSLRSNPFSQWQNSSSYSLHTFLTRYAAFSLTFGLDKKNSSHSFSQPYNYKKLWDFSAVVRKKNHGTTKAVHHYGYKQYILRAFSRW